MTFTYLMVRPTYHDPVFRTAPPLPPPPSKIQDLRSEGSFFSGVLRKVFTADDKIVPKITVLQFDGSTDSCPSDGY